MSIKNIFAGIGVFITLFVAAWGAYEYIAPKSDLKALAADFGYYKTQVRLNAVTEEIWNIQGYYQCREVQDCLSRMPEHEGKLYQRLLLEREELSRAIGEGP